ncbi:MAG: V-type ATPase subunit [Clostridiales bacterium]|nr:V-type ATPase subunit [Clostridiales bacterium]
MRETEYAYAVARIRVNELKLLTTAELDQLVTAADYSEAMRKLADKGWPSPDSAYDYAKMLEDEADEAWNLIKEIIPDIHELDMLIVKNDFHNLKAALKCSVNDDDNPEDFYVKPSCIDTSVITQAVDNHDFSVLPEYMQEAAKKAYDMIVKVNNGQLADVVLDTAAMETMISMAEKTGSSLLVKIADLICATANIKAAYRSAKTNKGQDFVQLIIADNKTLDKQSLIENTIQGVEKLIAYLENTQYAEPAKYLKDGDTTAFEKWCDDELMKLVGQAKFTSFGVEPIVAYYIAKDAEIKSVRIILSAKLNNLSADTIKKRVRELYV